MIKRISCLDNMYVHPGQLLTYGECPRIHHSLKQLAFECYRRYLELKDQKCKTVAVVMCAKNEMPSITFVLPGVLPYADEVLLVDGSSTDSTPDYARDLGVRVITEKAYGKGSAIRAGIQNVNSDIIVFIDADGSHDPNDIPRILRPILNDEADLVVGSRILAGSDELPRKGKELLRMVGSEIITLGINLRFGKQLTDSQNGFRAIRRTVALELALSEQITTIEQEMTIKSLLKGYRIVEVSSHEYARMFGSSHIRLSRVALRYIYSWLKYILRLEESDSSREGRRESVER